MYVTPEQIQAANKANVESLLAIANAQFAAFEKFANISAGAVNTLAARGIAGFTDMLKHYEAHAPLKRNVTTEELGKTGAFLASDGAAAITGQTIYVDCGYQIMGMY